MKTLKRHWEHVHAFMSTPITNVVGKEINLMIKIGKNRVSGYRH